MNHQLLKETFPKIKLNTPFSTLTTLNIGGPIEALFIATTEEELIKIIQFAKKNFINFLVIGGGSNLLVSDTGFNGLVIKNNIKGIEQKADTLIVKSGTILQNLVDFTIKNRLSGLNKLTGIPGTVGGAVYGNAGAYGGSISEKILQIKCFDNQETITLSKNQAKFAYRDSVFKKNKFTILEIIFKLEKTFDDLKTESEQILIQRLKKYPPGIKCPGSFFKNIVAESLSPNTLSKIPKEKIVYGKIPTGSLLEDVGAKGQKLGDIEIASYHANLFINHGKGSAKDFCKLAFDYAQKVKDKFNITLEPEVQLINLPLPLKV